MKKWIVIFTAYLLSGCHTYTNLYIQYDKHPVGGIVLQIQDR